LILILLHKSTVTGVRQQEAKARARPTPERTDKQICTDEMLSRDLSVNGEKAFHCLVTGVLIIDLRMPQVGKTDFLEILPGFVLTMWRAAAEGPSPPRAPASTYILTLVTQI